MDEPFRGLDRLHRKKMLDLAKARWNESTLLCVTRDIDETLGFNRVLVLDAGRIVEDGNPTKLADDASSRYAGLLENERLTDVEIWQKDHWKRMHLEKGKLVST